MGKVTLGLLVVLLAIIVIMIPVGIVNEVSRSSWCNDRGYKTVRTGQYGPSLCYDPKTRQVYNPE